MSDATTPTTQVAKKAHRCSWCGERIEANEKYTRWRYFDGGDAVTIKMHQECVIAQAREAARGENEFELYENERGERSPQP